MREHVTYIMKSMIVKEHFFMILGNVLWMVKPGESGESKKGMTQQAVNTDCT